MSKGSEPRRGKRSAQGKPDGKDQPSGRARRKQMIVAVALGLVFGAIISALNEFWLYLPAGAALGLATGAIMKPPGE